MAAKLLKNQLLEQHTLKIQHAAVCEPSKFKHAVGIKNQWTGIISNTFMKSKLTVN